MKPPNSLVGASSQIRLSTARRTLARVTGHVILVMGGILSIVPFYWMFIRATHTDREMVRWPPPLLPGTSAGENLDLITSSFPMWRNFFNSVFVATSYMILSVLVCSLAAYALAFYRQAPGRNAIFFGALATMMIPSSLNILPYFLLMVQFGWINNFLALIVPSAAPVFGVFWLHQYMRHSIPIEILEAARVDGAGPFKIYARIVMPLSRPALAALAILMFLTSWNDFFAPLLVMTHTDMYTFTLMLNTLRGDLAPRISETQLGIVIGTIPILIVFALASRHFLAGMTLGGVKE